MTPTNRPSAWLGGSMPRTGSSYELRDDGKFVARSRDRVTAYRASRRARYLGSSVNRADGSQIFRITKTVYRGQEGFLISGRGRGTFRTRIFTTKRENAEAIRDALRRDDQDAISKILLAEADEADASHRRLANRAGGGDGSGTDDQVPHRKADADRFAKLRADYLTKYDAARDFAISLSLKYGSEREARLWAGRGDKVKLEKLDAAKSSAADKIIDLIQRLNPHRNFSYGFPLYWLAEKLTWEDAITLGPMSVVPPPAYGMSERDMQAIAGPIRK